MAIQTEPTRIQIPFADSGTKNVIPDTNSTPSASQAASWTDGFPAQCSLPLSAGGIPPARADFNGIFNTMTQSERFTQEGGVWAWDATVDYGTNRVVLGSDGLLYWSVAQSGPNVGGTQDPTADDGTYWQAMPLDDSNLVHKTGEESIGGHKTFTDYITTNGSIYLKDDNIDMATPPSINNNWYVLFTDKNGLGINGLRRRYTTSSVEIHLILREYGDTTSTAANLPSVVFDWTSARTAFHPSSSSFYLGYTSGQRWAAVYAVTGSIQTSDARLKTEPEPFPDEVLDAWGDVEFYQFQMLSSVAEKGADKARLHSGLIAQRIEAAFEARGLDACRYGLFCHDTWEEQPEQRDENGIVIEEAREAGDEYSLRYEEALCMEAAYQRRRADRAEARLAALEERLATIEAKLG